MIQAESPRDNRQPGADVVNIGSTRQSEKRLLRDVLSLPHIAEHLIREVHQIRAMAAYCGVYWSHEVMTTRGSEKLRRPFGNFSPRAAVLAFMNTILVTG